MGIDGDELGLQLASKSAHVPERGRKSKRKRKNRRRRRKRDQESCMVPIARPQQQEHEKKEPWEGWGGERACHLALQRTGRFF